MLAYILADSKCQSACSPQATGSFLPFIPSRLGHNAALDAAVSCLCGIYGDRQATTREPTPATMQKYGASLRILRTFVADSMFRTQSETICASIVLQICEVRLPFVGGPIGFCVIYLFNLG